MAASELQVAAIGMIPVQAVMNFADQDGTGSSHTLTFDTSFRPLAELTGVGDQRGCVEPAPTSRGGDPFHRAGLFHKQQQRLTSRAWLSFRRPRC